MVRFCKKLIKQIADIENLIEDIDVNSDEGDIDVEELSRTLESMEIMNTLDQEEERNEIETISEKVPVEEEQPVEAVDQTTVEEQPDKAENQDTEEGQPDKEVDQATEDVTVEEKPLEEPQSTQPTQFTLIDLFSETNTLSRSSALIPEEYNTRLFMLNQQLSSPQPGTSSETF